MLPSVHKIALASNEAELEILASPANVQVGGVNEKRGISLAGEVVIIGAYIQFGSAYSGDVAVEIDRAGMTIRPDIQTLASSPHFAYSPHETIAVLPGDTLRIKCLSAATGNAMFVLRSV